MIISITDLMSANNQYPASSIMMEDGKPLIIIISNFVSVKHDIFHFHLAIC